MKDSEIVSKLIFLAFIAAPPEPVQSTDDGTGMLAWSDAMGLYARCIEREAHLLPDPLGWVIPGNLQVMTQEDHKAAHEGLRVTCQISPEVAEFAKDIAEKCEAKDAEFSAAVAALDDPLSVLEPEPEPDEPMKPGLILDPPPIYPEQPSPLDGPVELRAKDIKRELSTVPKFTGPNAKMKRETFDRMAQFRLQHGLGSYQTVSEATGGICTEWQLWDMMDNKPAPQSRWDALKKALDKLEGGK